MAVGETEVRAGADIPELRRAVTTEDVHGYAEASGDRNPLHLDDHVARGVGFPSVIAHGMLTMGHLASCLTSWLGDGGRIVRLRTPFRAVVLPDDVIVAGGRVKTVDDLARRAVLEVWVTVERDGATEYPIRRGEAEVELVGTTRVHS